MDPSLTCEPCMHRDVGSRATKYCTDCEESQCDVCAEVHKSCKATRTHLLVNIEDCQVSSRLSNDLKQSQACKEHTSKRMEFYCAYHKEFLCGTCLLINTKHRSCTEMVTLSSWDTNALNAFTNKVFNDIDKTILDAIYTREELHNVCKKSMDGVKEVGDKLNDIRDRFIALFDEQKNKVIKNAEEKNKKHTNQCKELVEDNKAKATLVEETGRFLRAIVNSKREADVFHCIMLAIERMEKLKKQTDKACKNSTVITVSFENSPVLQAVEDKSQLIKFKFEETNTNILKVPLQTTCKDDVLEHIISCNKATVTDDQSEPDCNNPTQEKSNDYCISKTVTKPQRQNENVKAQTTMTTNGSINASGYCGKNDDCQLDTASLQRAPLSRSKSTSIGNLLHRPSAKRAGISKNNAIKLQHTDTFEVTYDDCAALLFGGFICLHDDRLLLSDKLNKKLIVLDKNHNKKEKIKLRYPPGNLSFLGDDGVLVCLMKTNQILLMKINGEELKPEGYLPTRFHPKCAQGIDENNLLVSMKDGLDNWFFDILNDNGTIEKTIKIENMNDGYTIAVQILPDLEPSCFRIIQYCGAEEKLCCFEPDGNIVFSYDIDRVNYVLTDKNGHIFIIRDTGEVRVLSPEGQHKGHFHKSSMYKATFAAFSRTMDKLYIAKLKEQTIHVLKVDRL